MEGNICIIPARGGSKRIPRKNIKDFLGKPIIAYSIDVALSSGLFDEVMVSTDDQKIAEVARKYGAQVPFLRSRQNADDFATTASVLKEVIENYSTIKSIKFDFSCCIYPTAPLILKSHLLESFEKLKAGEFDSLFTVVDKSKVVWRALGESNGKLYNIFPENASKRTQDLPNAFQDAGMFYWFTPSTLIHRDSIQSENTGFYMIDELYCQDIDTIEDWQLAELKYKLLLHNSQHE